MNLDGIAAMPRGGPDASWLDRRLQADALEYTDRYDILELGAGHGKLSQSLLCQNAHVGVTVSDLDPHSVATIAASPLGDDPRVTVRVIDAAAIDAPDTCAGCPPRSWRSSRC